MSSFLEQCRAGVVIGDGAMGTEMQRAGLEPGSAGERWVLDHPDRIAAIQAAYVAAGSDAIITASFGANRWVLGRYGLADQVEAINREAASIARRVAGRSVTVLGDIGPFGGFLKPLGEVGVDEVTDAFTLQARALLAGGADGIVVETMSALDEAVAAVTAARRAGAPFVIASMTFEQRARTGLRTMMGVTPAQAAAELAAAGADVVGANCGTGLGLPEFAEIVAVFRQTVDRPVMIQPNAGQPVLEHDRAVYRMTPAEFADGMRMVVAAGASVVGGCCGTTPAHIGALREALRRGRRES